MVEGVWEQGAEENIWTDVLAGSRKLHEDELHNLYSSPSTIRMIKSKWMRWVGHVARIHVGEEKCI
jgi:hypothetical protein